MSQSRGISVIHQFSGDLEHALTVECRIKEIKRDNYTTEL